MRDVRLVVIDPNLGALASWWRTAYKVSNAIHTDEPSEILRWLREEITTGSDCSGPVAPTASRTSAPSCPCCWR
ncbi:predicted protein [Streptomyces sp. SPB78]|nr:predicted protein [Streptomyces sp. SPB78]